MSDGCCGNCPMLDGSCDCFGACSPGKPCVRPSAARGRGAMSEHTREPWRVGERCSRWIKVLFHDSLICEVSTERNCAEGNARLIAAPPDLLAALKVAHERFTCGKVPMDCPAGCQFRAAISKATQAPKGEVKG